MTRSVLFRTAKQRQGDRKRAQKLRGKSRSKSYLRVAAEGATAAIVTDASLSGALAYRAARKNGASKESAITTAKNITKSRFRPHNLIKTGATGAAYGVAERVGVEVSLRRRARAGANRVKDRDRKYRKFSDKTQNIITFKKSRTTRQRAGDLARALKLKGRGKRKKGLPTKRLALGIGGLALGVGAGYGYKKSPVARELIRVGLSAKDEHYQTRPGGSIKVQTKYDDRHGLVQRGKSAYLTARNVKKSRLESAKTAWKAMGRQLERGKRNNPSKREVLEKINKYKKKRRQEQRISK